MVILEQIRTETPPFMKSQRDSLTWLSEAFSAASRASSQAENLKTESPDFERLLEKVGVKPAQVGHRGHYLPDYAQALHDGAPNSIFTRQVPEGRGLDERMRFYAECSHEIVNRLLPLQEFRRLPRAGEPPRPRDLIHVSCTGYVSPSPTQNWIAQHELHESVQSYHLYHMGCYAALPAIRLAESLARTQREVHIVHTELCTLHLRTRDPRLEDLVIHSLFADGAVAYKVRSLEMSLESDAEAREIDALELVKSAEAIIPNSSSAMTWGLGAAAFHMTLSKDVPRWVGGRLPGLLREVGFSLNIEDEGVVWAIHPGGPKIIDHLQEVFRLKDHQIQHSRKILFERGNMSSATLPYVWKEILEDSRVPHGADVLAMAFGPGLTICLQHFRVNRVS
jgi:predicted naringenin-chalcone synthase